MTTTTAADIPTAEHNATAWLADHAAGDILMTPDGWLLEANRPAIRMLRLPEGQQARGLNFRRFCRQPARLTEAVQAVQGKGCVGGWDGDLIAFDGWPVHAVVNLVGQFERGVLIAVRAQSFDITEWRRGQERTLFGQRIEAIGRLAGGVAHDFNNLLTVISGHAECLSLAISADSPLNRSVAAIQASAARAATLTQKLLSFGRRQVLQPRVVDLADLVRKVETNLRRRFGHRVLVTTESAPPVRPVRVDPGQTEQALATIATHAIDAMPDGGAIGFRVSAVDIGPEWSPSRSFVKPGRFTQLDITCSGMTLDIDTQLRMFEPFFSEKGAVRDGIGLAAVLGLVKQSGGYLWVEGERVGETTFTVLLPAEAADADAVEPAPEPNAPAAGTILVVDDDDAVRGLIVKILERQGYVVLEAASAETGLRLGQTQPVDLLISDVVLDGARGDDLGAALLRLRPQMRLLCISGSPAGTYAADPLDPARAGFLEKPFSAAQLLDHVRGLLEP